MRFDVSRRTWFSLAIIGLLFTAAPAPARADWSDWNSFTDAGGRDLQVDYSINWGTFKYGDDHRPTYKCSFRFQNRRSQPVKVTIDVKYLDDRNQVQRCRIEETIPAGGTVENLGDCFIGRRTDDLEFRGSIHQI